MIAGGKSSLSVKPACQKLPTSALPDSVGDTKFHFRLDITLMFT